LEHIFSLFHTYLIQNSPHFENWVIFHFIWLHLVLKESQNYCLSTPY
jgi:hypothetical protein